MINSIALLGFASAGTAAPNPGGGALERFPPTIMWKDTTLDWFSYTGAGASEAPLSFEQRILYTDHYWDTTTKNGPLLVFFGGEGACEDFYNNTGAVFEIAAATAAKVIFLEHRYGFLLRGRRAHCSSRRAPSQCVWPSA